MNIRKTISKLSFRIWESLSPSLHETYQGFGLRMFFQKEMKKDFPWKKYIKQKNPYFKKWGFDVSMLDAEYYSQISGIRSDRYVTRSMAMHYIYPYLDRYEFHPAYSDKNFQKIALDFDSATKQIGVLATEDIVYNSNGIFYDAKRNIISREQALTLLCTYSKDMILKPSVETYGGQGVQKIPANRTREELEALIDKYYYNFTFQKVIDQHPDLAACNPTSTNTIRIVTYRKPNKELKVLYACLRFGGEGSVIDNVCSGGGYTGINIANGTLLNRKRYSYFTLESPVLPATFPNEIPAWNKIKEAALFLHNRLPHFDIAGWDFSVTPDGQPLFLEVNLRPGVGLQQAIGPMFSDEDLDELMEHVSKYTLECRPLGILRFKDLPGRTTVHYKFGR